MRISCTFCQLLMLSLFLSHQVIAVEKYGNYLDSRIGIPSEISSHGLLFYPDRELMYDFDTEKPTAGITSENSKIVPDNKYFMTSPNSLRWESKTGSVLNFTSGVKLIKTLKCNYYFSVGLFQEKKTTDGSLRTFKVEAKDEAGNLVVNLQLYLHRCGWNIAAIQLPATFTKVISKIEIMQNGGAEGEVYVDNLMLYNGYMAGISSSPNIYEPTVTDKSAFPAKSTLSADEVKGFKAINDRILNTQDPKVFNLQELEKTDKNNNSQTSKLNRVSPTTMTRFRDLYKSYNIQQIGKFANGENPLYYSRKLQGYDLQEASPEDYYYKKNTTLCQTMREMGMTWYRLSDSPERAELGKMICDLVRLSTTYGGLPNPWYNGRGFADGIFFARELLAKEGLIDDITEQLMQQYNVDRVLYNEHTLNITKKSTRTLAVSNPSTPEFYWNSTADHLNTASLSMISIVAMSPDSPEKARDFIRLKSWLDNIALNYAPSTMGTLKPDGSLFHHWGNRFDNYGWVAGWRGATQYVWWLSKTPFRVSEQTHQRMQHMAKVHFQLMNKDGYAGSPDKQMPIPADGFYFMASAGSPDGSQVYDPLTASYLLSFPESETYRKFPEVIANIKKQGITEAPRANENITMSYAGLNIHRFGSWQAYAHGVSKSLYHTQYVRRGFLFYNIGGFNLLKEGQTSSMQNEKGASILRGKTEEKNITPGYNFSLAPGVTSIVNDLSKLDQKYYQNGSSEFVGGVSTNDNSGIFTQIFDSGDNFNDVDPKDKEFREVSTNKNIYAGTVAEKLSFKKSYFYFGRDIVLIASNISNGVKLTNVQTGILQERVIDGANRLILADKTSTEADTVDREIKSTEVPWFVNETQKIGYYLYPNQTYRLKKGIQTFISTGEIVSSYFEHQKQIVGEYAFVLRLETSKDEMKEFGKSMKSKTPDYQILQQDANAHIVKATKINQTGYVLYNPKGLIFDDKRIKSVNNSCVFMMKDDLAKKEMIISFANPDKNMILTKDNPLGYSLPIKTVVVLNGRYELISADNKLVNCEFDTSNQTTNITFEVKDGLSNTVRLQMSNH